MMWNLWHGCHKKSEGCQHCYVYRRDASFEKDANIVTKTTSFSLPVRRDRSGSWKVPSGTLMWTCFTSDFFIEEADAWREEAWLMIHRRSDLHFFMTTKRIERFEECKSADWDDGYRNVTIAVTVENQQECDRRLPVYIPLPIRHKMLICEPLLEAINFRSYLHEELFEMVIVGGESGPEARPCDFEWVKQIRLQCINSGTAFHFKQTGACFVMNGRTYHVERNLQKAQAQKANIDWNP